MTINLSGQLLPLIATLWINSTLVSGISKPNLNHLVTKLRKLPVDDEIISCKFGPDKKTFLLFTKSEKKTGYAEKQTKYNLRFFLLNGRRFNQIVIDGPSVDTLLRKKQILPPVFTFLPSRNAATICRQKNINSDPEIEYWDLKNKKMTSYLKIPFKNCNNSMHYMEHQHTLAVLSDNGSDKILWNLESGVPRPITEILEEKKCVGFNQDASLAYCFNQNLDLFAYDLLDGEKKISFQLPDSLAPPFYKTGIWKLSRLIDQKIPKYFDSIFFSPPSFAMVLQDTGQLIRWYTNNQDRFQDDEYGLMIWNSTKDGQYLKHQIVHPPQESSLRNIVFDKNSLAIIAEDFNPARSEFKMITHIKIGSTTGGKIESGQKSKRTGSPCTQSWDFWPATEEVLTCGICEGKNEFNLIPMREKAPSASDKKSQKSR